MKKLLSFFVLLLAGSTWLMAQQSWVQGHVITYVPFTPCVGQPVHFSAIDTSGAFTMATMSWNFGDGGTAWSYTPNPTVTHVYSAPGTYNVTFSAWDSLTWNWDTDTLVLQIDSICANHDNISGVAYYDANSNGSQDFGEPGYPNSLLEINPGGYFVSTDNSGNWAVNMTPGTWTISAHPPQYFTVSEPVGNSYSVTSTGSGASHPGNDFGFAPTSNMNDLRVSYYHAPPVPGFNRTVTLYYQNVGTTVLNSTVTLQLDPAVTFVSASSGGTHSSGTVTWNVGNLFPGTSGWMNAMIYVPVATPLNTPISHVATINPVSGDVAPADNVDIDTMLVVASYDPNDKTASPAGQGASGGIAPGTPLTYTIRFQNTGNFYATDVVLRDTLDADLDQSTLEVLGSSHPMTWHLDFGKLAFEFRGIMLPDSNTNEPASHGWVQYRIQHKSGLPLGTEITNSASIYFDFNAPVLTNTTLNTLEELTSVVPGRNTMGLKMAPNPFSSTTRFEFDRADGAGYRMVLRDLSGRTVMVQEGITGSSFQLDGSSLPAGMYLATFMGAEGVAATAKIVKE